MRCLRENSSADTFGRDMCSTLNWHQVQSPFKLCKLGRLDFMNHMYLKYLTCESQTGEHYELGKLAPGKYKKVMAETRLIQVSKTEIYVFDRHLHLL